VSVAFRYYPPNGERWSPSPLPPRVSVALPPGLVHKCSLIRFGVLVFHMLPHFPPWHVVCQNARAVGLREQISGTVRTSTLLDSLVFQPLSSVLPMRGDFLLVVNVLGRILLLDNMDAAHQLACLCSLSYLFLRQPLFPLARI